MFVELIVNTITDGVVDSCTQHKELNVFGRTNPSSAFFFLRVARQCQSLLHEKCRSGTAARLVPSGPQGNLGPCTVSKPDPLNVPPRLHLSPKNIYVCMRHGPMMGDTVQERDLTSRCVPGMDKKALVDIAYCLQCNLKANGWSVETSSEEDSSEQGEVLFETRSTEEEYKAREKDCFHEYKVKGANQYGSWDKCLECRAKFNYKERPKYKEKYENEAKDGKGTTTDQGDDPEKDSKPKQATASSTSASSTSATSTLPTRRQINYLRLLAGKLKIKVEIPADIIEASMLINDLRDEVDRLGLWR